MGLKARKEKPQPTAWVSVRPMPWSVGQPEGWPKDALGCFAWVTLYADGSGWTRKPEPTTCGIDLSDVAHAVDCWMRETRDDEGEDAAYEIRIEPQPLSPSLEGSA